mmetsp:Transcript_17137/g.46404  ORF Transcript_17137/g.46404 Transcript_17137/m.46404 type:complete len:274 (+) Transcript_17137:466-1287(+)
MHAAAGRQKAAGSSRRCWRVGCSAREWSAARGALSVIACLPRLGRRVDQSRALERGYVLRRAPNLRRVVVVDLAPLVKLDPLGLVLVPVAKLLEEANRVAVVWERDAGFALGGAVHLVEELATPLVEVTRLVVQDYRVRHGHRVGWTAESVRAIQLGGRHGSPGGLAVDVGEHALLGEGVYVLKVVDRLNGGGDSLEVGEGEIRRAPGRRVHNVAERFLQPDDLVVIHVEEPLDAPFPALGEGGVHMRALAILQSPVVVLEVARISLLCHRDA